MILKLALCAGAVALSACAARTPAPAIAIGCPAPSLSPSTANDAQLAYQARLVAAHNADLRRQDETIDKLTQQLRESQRRNEQLGNKLEALKNIERALAPRPAAPVAR